MIKAVFFDLDGTVLNTLPDLVNVTNTTIRELGYPEHTAEEIRMMVGNGMFLLLGRALPEGVAVTDEIFQHMKQNYMKLQNTYTEEYPGVRELLTELHARGLKTAIITNKPDVAAKDVAAHYFGELIDVAIGVRDGGKVKPDPGTCFEAMEQLGLKKGEVIYVGDADTDIETARNAGMPCLSATWGFRGREFLLAHGAKTVIDKPLDVLDYVPARLRSEDL